MCKGRLKTMKHGFQMTFFFESVLSVRFQHPQEASSDAWRLKALRFLAFS